MPTSPDRMNAVMLYLKQIESTVLGMKLLLPLIAKDQGRDLLDALIAEAEVQICKIKRRLVQ